MKGCDTTSIKNINGRAIFHQLLKHLCICVCACVSVCAFMHVRVRQRVGQRVCVLQRGSEKEKKMWDESKREKKERQTARKRRCYPCIWWIRARSLFFSCCPYVFLVSNLRPQVKIFNNFPSHYSSLLPLSSPFFSYFWLFFRLAPGASQKKREMRRNCRWIFATELYMYSCDGTIYLYLQRNCLSIPTTQLSMHTCDGTVYRYLRRNCLCILATQRLTVASRRNSRLAPVANRK